jgi:hypothetical protein
VEILRIEESLSSHIGYVLLLQFEGGKKVAELPIPCQQQPRLAPQFVNSQVLSSHMALFIYCIVFYCFILYYI